MSAGKKPLPVDPAFEGRTDAPFAPIDGPAARPVDGASAPAPAPAPATPAAPRKHALAEGRMKQAESARNTWRVNIPAGDIEHLATPGYWVHVARKFRHGDLVEVLSEDWTVFALLIVRSVDLRAGVVMNPLSLHRLEVLHPNENAGFDVKHVPGLDWVIVRKGDGARVSENHRSQADAYAWLAANAGRI